MIVAFRERALAAVSDSRAQLMTAGCNALPNFTEADLDAVLDGLVYDLYVSGRCADATDEQIGTVLWWGVQGWLVKEQRARGLVQPTPPQDREGA